MTRLADSSAPRTDPLAASSVSASVERQTPAEVTLSWRCWPLVRYASWSWGVVLAILAAAGYVWLRLDSILLGVISALLLVLSVRWFLAPTRVQVDDSGVRLMRMGFTSHVSWSSIADYRADAIGVVLLPSQQSRPLDALRGTFVPCDGDTRHRLVELLDHRLNRRPAALTPRAST